MAKKPPTKAERRHMNAVQALGCIACRKLGHWGTPAEIHHITTGKGMGQRATNLEVIPLCPHHHRQGGHGEAIHGGQKTWEARFGTELELLEEVNQQLGMSHAERW